VETEDFRGAAGTGDEPVALPEDGEDVVALHGFQASAVAHPPFVGRPRGDLSSASAFRTRPFPPGEEGSGKSSEFVPPRREPPPPWIRGQARCRASIRS